MTPYGPDAIDFALRLYLKYNGQQHDRIESEMRRAGWSGWSRKNLYTRGKGKQQRLGWIEKFGWERALQLHLAEKPTATLNDAEQLVREVKEIRQQLFRIIKAQGANVDKEKLQLHRDYSNLSISALTKVEAARDTLGGWVHFWERLVDWAVDVDAKFAKVLIKYADAIIERAEKEFGETEEMSQQFEGQTADVSDREDAAAQPGTQDSTGEGGHAASPSKAGAAGRQRRRN